MRISNWIIIEASTRMHTTTGVNKGALSGRFVLKSVQRQEMNKPKQTTVRGNQFNEVEFIKSTSHSFRM